MVSEAARQTQRPLLVFQQRWGKGGSMGAVGRTHPWGGFGQTWGPLQCCPF